MSGFSKWRAVKVSRSKSPKNRGETGIFAEDDAEVKDRDSKTDRKVIVLLNRRHISSLFA